LGSIELDGKLVGSKKVRVEKLDKSIESIGRKSPRRVETEKKKLGAAGFSLGVELQEPCL